MKKLIFLLLVPVCTFSQELALPDDIGSHFPSMSLLQQLESAKTNKARINALLELYLDQVNIKDNSAQGRATEYYRQLMEAVNIANDPGQTAVVNMWVIRRFPVFSKVDKWSLIRESFNYAHEHKLTDFQIEALIQEAYYFRHIRLNFKRAIDTLQVALKMSEGLDSSRIQVYCALAAVYNFNNDYVHAIENAYEALNLSYKLKSLVSQFDASQILGITYSRLKVYDKAIDFFQQAISCSQQLQKPNGVISGKINLTTVYINTGEWGYASECLRNITHLLDSLSVNKVGRNRVAVILFNVVLGLSPDILEIKPDKKVVEQLLAVNRDCFFITPQHVFRDNVIFAMASYQLGKVDTARKYLDAAGSLIPKKDIFSLELARYYLVAGTIEKATGNENLAFENYQKGLQLAKELNLIKLTKAITDSLEAICVSQKDFPAAYKYNRISDSIQRFLLQQSDNRAVVLQEIAGIEQIQERLKTEAIQRLRQKKLIWYGAIALLFLAVVTLTVRRRINNNRKGKIKHEKELLELEAKALRAQMNPHFIFNCLNSIKALIQHDEKQRSVDYLTTFSKLIRTLFQNSDKRQISLYDEIETCRLYTQLEAMRLNGKLRYNFEIDPGIDLKSLMVPALIVQPFIENAIWHGIVPKEGEGLVTVRVSGNDVEIVCTVDDDGIGRGRSKLNKPVTQVFHESKGVHLSQARMNLEKKLNDTNSSLETRDKYHNETATGTIVILTFNLN